jgi:hypothetical protein
MTLNNQAILLAKIDTLYSSIGDPQLQAVVALLRDLAGHVEVTDKGELGFGQNTNATE